MKDRYIDLEIQGGIIRRFTDLVLDYTGTLSLDGVLLTGVAERLAGIAAGSEDRNHRSGRGVSGAGSGCRCSCM